MSIAVRFYTFNKKVNSTKVPTGNGTLYNCTLKDDTSILEPVIRLQTSNNVKVYNYAYIADFSRYYFVTDVVSSKGFWEISLKVDPMASEKTGIGAMSPYVLRAASESDEYILDTAYPADSYVTEHIAYDTAQGHENPFAGSSPSYCLGIIGFGSDPVGSVCYYAMTQAQLMAFIGYLMGDVTVWSDISTSDYSAGVQRALINPMQYIVSCVKLPVEVPFNQTAVDSLMFGTNEYTGTGIAYALSGSLLTDYKMGTILLPSHPQASTRGKYLNGAPYSKYWLHVGPYGDIPLNGNLGSLITAGATDDDRYITYYIKFDKPTGICNMVVYPGKKGASFDPYAHDTGDRLASVTFQGGIPVQLASAYTDPLLIQQKQANLISAAAGSVAGGMSNPIGSAIGALGSIPAAVGDLMRAQYGTVNSNGTNGAIIQTIDAAEGIYIRSEHNRIVPENNTDLGRPLCQLKQLNTLSGFILCSGADYGGAGTARERDEINGYLNGGFFYE